MSGSLTFYRGHLDLVFSTPNRQIMGAMAQGRLKRSQLPGIGVDLAVATGSLDSQLASS